VYRTTSVLYLSLWNFTANSWSMARSSIGTKSLIRMKRYKTRTVAIWSPNLMGRRRTTIMHLAIMHPFLGIPSHPEQQQKQRQHQAMQMSVPLPQHTHCHWEKDSNSCTVTLFMGYGSLWHGQFEFLMFSKL
jgi:hypothetical protein